MADNAQGVQWPEKSTTAVNRRIFAACTSAMAATSAGEEATKLTTAMEEEKNWRHGYTKHLFEMAKMMAATPEAAQAQAKAGLAAVAAEFVYVQGETRVSVADAVAGAGGITVADVETETHKGTGAVSGIQVPIVVKGKENVLEKDTLRAQAKAWAEYGSCQNSVAKSIEAVTALPAAELASTLDKRVFCLFGGTSELCPARPLLKMGATVAAIGRPGSKLDELVAFAEETAGTLLLPKVGDKAGLDIMSQLPETAAWFCGLAEAHPDKVMTVGTYVYLDGELNMRVSAAVDAIYERLQRTLPPARFELALLASPGTAHLWPADAARTSVEEYKNRPWWSPLARLKSNVADPKNLPRVFDGHMNMQGPNYALAQTLRLWRCVVAREQGSRVSANMTPACRTASMTKSAAMRILLDGAQGIKPLLILQAPTCSHFMAALLVSDLTCDTAADPKKALDHPWELFVDNAFDGGVWACPFSQDSLTIPVGIMGKLGFYPGTVGLVSESRDGCCT